MIVTREFFEQAEDGIYVCYTPISFPLNYFIHTYIVTKVGSELNRYEVYYQGDGTRPNGYIFKNLMTPWTGCHVFFKERADSPGRVFSCRLLTSYRVSSEENIYQLIEKIENRYHLFPLKDEYSYIGSNSNTYTAWLLEQIGIDYKLPWRAWGKNHKKYI